jgi:hypothetical protein
MKTIQVLPRQTLWDIAIQEYGSVMGAPLIVKDNKLNGYMPTLTPGQTLKIRVPVAGAGVDVAIARYYDERKLKPVSIRGNDFLVPDFNENDFN